MKKIALTLVAISTLGLAACGDNAATNNTSNVSETETVDNAVDAVDNATDNLGAAVENLTDATANVVDSTTDAVANETKK